MSKATSSNASSTNQQLVLTRVQKKKNSIEYDTNYWKWERAIIGRLAAQFPRLEKELIEEPVLETTEETFIRLSNKYKGNPLLNENVEVLPEEIYNQVQAVPAAGRKRAEQLAIEELRRQHRETNMITRAENDAKSAMLKKEVEIEEQKAQDRVTMSKTILLPEFVTAEAAEDIRSHPTFIKNGYNSAMKILGIARTIFGTDGVPAVVARIRAEKTFRAMEQNLLHPSVHNQNVRDMLDKCQRLGSVFTQPDLIDNYIENLNSDIFLPFKRDFYKPRVPPNTAPTTLEETMIEAYNFFNSEKNINPSIIKLLNSSSSFAAYSMTEGQDESVSSVRERKDKELTGKRSRQPSPTGDPCQLCRMNGHQTRDCWKLLDPKYLKPIQDKIRPIYQEAQQRYQEKYETRSKAKASSAKKDEDNSVSFVSVDTPDDERKANDYAVETICSVCEPPGEAFNLQHDDSASISCIMEKHAALFESLVRGNATIQGFTIGPAEATLGRGTLKFDLGRAVLVSDPHGRSLISCNELKKAYHKLPSPEDKINYKHRVTGDIITFRCDRARFGDNFYHLLLTPDDSAETVSSLDFYNPKPLEPILPADEPHVWPQILAVERLHWIADHMSITDMTRLCTKTDYAGPVTPEAIALFVKHRGCSSCRLANMKEHSQYLSTRGLSETVGECAQGDIFYIRLGKELAPIPILLLTCEATKFTYMYAFVEAATRASGNRVMVRTSEMRGAFEHALQLWTHARHPLQILRFDREAAVVTATIEDLVRSKGGELRLTAAGQKLGLAEVSGRIAKDRSRACLAGIKEKYGYTYPNQFLIKLVADVCSLRNQMVRKGCHLSPYQLFFGRGTGLDVERDLRVAIGEIVLAKKPKKGVASHIDEFRAEWGIVVSRSFNGSGVFEAYLLESKAYGHRLKFERLPVPAYVMEMARALSERPPGPIPYEADDAAPLPQGSSSTETESPDLMDATQNSEPGATDEAVTIIDTNENEAAAVVLAVSNAQMTYAEALKRYPERAPLAMEKEVKQLLDKDMFQPRLVSEIPPEDRKLILPSFSAHKVKFDADGNFLKDKSRVLANGSRQVDLYTGESSSPVARHESIMMLAGYAAHTGWEVFKIDVVAGYPHAERPDEVKYKYLRLDKHVAAAVVKQRPEWSRYLNKDGSLIVELNRMIYGMKEAGYQFYLLVNDMYRAGGFKTSQADKCMIVRTEREDKALGTYSVDDALFAVNSPTAKEHIIKMYEKRFGKDGFVLTEGSTFDLLGMKMEWDRELKRVIVSQRDLALQLVEEAGVTKFARSPSDENLYQVAEDSEPLTEKDRYRSWVASLMYLASRTYPECLPAATFLSSRYVRATQEDLAKLMRAISYLGHNKDHCLVIRPASLDLVCSADASYAVHEDGKSHSGYCVGFKGWGDLPDSFCFFASHKQSLVTLSSCEAELVCANSGATSLVWGALWMEEIGMTVNTYDLNRVEATPAILQDNTSAIQVAEKGGGNFKNSKHIRVRYYYITDLVAEGLVKIVWQATSEMVADLLSKGVRWAVFSYLLYKLIGRR